MAQSPDPPAKPPKTTLVAHGGVAPETIVEGGGAKEPSGRSTQVASGMAGADGASAAQAPAATESASPAHRVASRETLTADETLAAGGASVEESHAPLGTQASTSTILPQARLGGVVKWIYAQKTRLEVLSQLGEGGVGEVLVAMDHDIGRKVAIKKIKSSVKSPEMILRFIEEIKTVGRLEHPNIIPIHDVGVDGQGDYYFVMKYVEGETLEEVIDALKAGDREAHRRYPFARRIEVFRGILEALNYAHSMRVIHRDIKPANVMIGPFGEVLLMDWGIAKELEREDDMLEQVLSIEQPEGEVDESEKKTERFWKTRVGGLIGTPAYMSPEQSMGEPLDERSDIYALFVLLHEFLTLTHYLDAKETLTQILLGVKEESPSLMTFTQSKHQPPVPMDLVWFVRKGLKKEREKRYQSIQEVLERLDLRARGIIPVECHITLMKRFNAGLNSFMDRHPMFATMGLMGLLGGAGYGIFQLFV